jgi:hypothetical protein
VFWQIGNKRLKVQHKQIRSRDMQDRDSPDDSFLGSADLSFQRTQFSSSLPPSGPAANATLWSESTQINGGENENELEPSNQQHPEDSIAFKSTPTAESTQIIDHIAEEANPLSLVQLQNALPDIPAPATTN